MYELIRNFKNVDLLVDKSTKRVVAIANKFHNHISRACSIEELAKHFVIADNSVIKYFGNISEAFLEGEILVAKCIYTDSAVKISVADNLFPMTNSAVNDTWRLATRINELHTINHKERGDMHVKMNNMFVTYAGSAGATRDNITMLAIVKHIDPEGNSFTDVFNNLQKDSGRVHYLSMYDLLEGLAVFSWPYQVKFDQTPEMDVRVIEFFNKEQDGTSILNAAKEFIKAWAISNQRPITSGDAEYIQHS